MKHSIYPAIFHKSESGYWVEFPDLPGCLTEGKNRDEALKMAGDALFVYLNENDINKEPSDISKIEFVKGDFVSLVKAEAYESEDAINYKIAEAIEKGLEQKNFNKNQVAIILNVDRSYLTQIEHGKKKPSPQMAKRIGQLLNFDWNLFFI